MRVEALVFSTLVFLFPFAGARGAAAQDKEAARAHYEKGVELFNAGSYEEALVEFEASYAA